MAKILQVVAQPFGTNASAGQLGVFGSKAAGSPATTTNPATMQSLSQWLAGWYSAVISGNSPCIQDMNAFCYVVMYIFTYLQQQGVSEWNAGITYFIGSIVNVNGALFMSLTDTNIGNNPASSPTNWAKQGRNVRTVTGTDTATASDSVILANAQAGSFIENLPAASAIPAGYTLTIKNLATNGNTVTVTPNGADTIDGQATAVLNSGAQMDSVTLIAVSGTGWYII